MTTTDICRIAHDLSQTTIRSSDVTLCENVSFKDLNLSEKTYNGLLKCGFEKPSPIQLEAIPIGRCGFDLIVQSKAGTGKTCIFTVIALEALQFNKRNSTQTLIVAPTREIAIQIHSVISQIGSEHKNLRCALCIGGIELRRDRSELKQGNKHDTCQIVIGTPGRLKQLIELNILQTQQVELFVLDEADKLIDDQFKAQIDDIYKCLPSDKQMLVTSATYPDELDKFLHRYMQSAKSVKIGKELSLEAVMEFYIDSEAGQSNTKLFENKIQTLKLILLKCMVKMTKCFIFTNYQSRGPAICDKLNGDEELVQKFGVTNYICAELPQEKRNAVFNRFKQSNQKILVSTDVSARGIDIHDIELVINFDLPVDNTTYYHRIGRAGRFGQFGMAISIVSDDNIDHSMFRKSVVSKNIKRLTIQRLR